jgi:hypothetical protein
MRGKDGELGLCVLRKGRVSRDSVVIFGFCFCLLNRYMLDTLVHG